MGIFEYRFEILKKELDAIDSSIKKIDDLSNNIRNWTVLLWMGSVAVFLGDDSLRTWVILTAVPPLLFMLIDASWRKIQRRLVFRQNTIAEYLNSEEFEENVKSNIFSFELLDPLSRKEKTSIKFKEFTSFKRILRFPTISYIYIGLSVLSIILGILVLLIFGVKMKG